MAALLAFTMLAYANVWFIKLETRGISQEPSVESAAPDLSSMNKEEVGEYLVQRISDQWQNPASYLAALLQTQKTIAPQNIVPAPTQQPFQYPSQCNALFFQGTGSSLYSSKSQFAFEGPRAPNAPLPPGQSNRQNPAEYFSAYVNASDGSLEVMHFGNSPTGPSQGVSTLFRGSTEVKVNELAVSDRFLAYQLDFFQQGGGGLIGEAVLVAHAGLDGIFGNVDDPPPSPILDTRGFPGVSIFHTQNGGSIDIAGDKLVMILSVSGFSQLVILQATLSATGAPLNVAVPTISRALQYPPYGFPQLFGIRAAASGAVAFTVSPSSTRFTWGYFLSPGLDGVWDASGSSDDQLWQTGQALGGGFTGGIADVSKSGRMIVGGVMDTTPGAPAALLHVLDTGIDLVPNTPDDIGGPPFTPQGLPSTRSFGSLEIGDPIPQLPNTSRASTVRLMATLYDQGWQPTLLFLEDGGDYQIGMLPDVVRTIPLPVGPPYLMTMAFLATEQPVGFLMSTVNSSPGPSQFQRVQWCF